MRKDVTKWIIKYISYYCIWQALLSELAIYIEMDDVSELQPQTEAKLPWMDTSASILCW